MINDQSSASLISLLNARLADTIDLLYQAKQAHWNVSGSDFYALHELFEKISDELLEHVDEIAERIVQLGGEAEGTIRMTSARSSLPEYPRNLADGTAHLGALSTALAASATSMYEAIGQCERLGDPVTVDILTGAAREIEKLRWMVQAHGTKQPSAQPERAPVERKPEAAARPRH